MTKKELQTKYDNLSSAYDQLERDEEKHQNNYELALKEAKERYDRRFNELQAQFKEMESKIPLFILIEERLEKITRDVISPFRYASYTQEEYTNYVKTLKEQAEASKKAFFEKYYKK